MSTEVATKNDVMSWVLDNGEKIKFTIEDAKNISGNPNVTDIEFALFGKLCAAGKLNPFIGDAFLIKYGNVPAKYITGKNSAVKIASRNKNYDGFDAGVIVLDKNNKVTHREGAMVYDWEKLVGGWAKVYSKNRSHPIYQEVSLKEYVGRKRDGSVNSMWAAKEATMIRKVPLSQALREAYPENLNGIYDESELAAIERGAEGKKQTTKSRVANIFNKKEDEEIIEGEAVEVKEDEPDVLTNELRIYVKALDVNTTPWLEKAHCESIEQLPPDIKQKCIDSLKPKYEALKQEKQDEKPDEVKEALKQQDMLKE